MNRAEQVNEVNRHLRRNGKVTASKWWWWCRDRVMTWSPFTSIEMSSDGCSLHRLQLSMGTAFCDKSFLKNSSCFRRPHWKQCIPFQLRFANRHSSKLYELWVAARALFSDPSVSQLLLLDGSVVVLLRSIYSQCLRCMPCRHCRVTTRLVD